MGSPEKAVLFIRECLDQPQKLNTTFDDDEEVQGPSVMKIGKHHYSDVDELKKMIKEGVYPSIE